LGYLSDDCLEVEARRFWIREIVPHAHLLHDPHTRVSGPGDTLCHTEARIQTLLAEEIQGAVCEGVAVLPKQVVCASFEVLRQEIQQIRATLLAEAHEHASDFGTILVAAQLWRATDSTWTEVILLPGHQH
jgi:hypothetical protein